MKSFRFADLSLVVKMALAPGFAVVMLAVIAGGAFWSQHQQTQAMNRIVDQDMSNSLELGRISKRITAVNGQLYQVLTHRAATPTADVTAALQGLLTEVDSIKADLTKVKASMPVVERKRYDAVIKDLADYRGGIEVLGSMLSLDFATAASFVEPFEVQYNRMTGTLDAATTEALADAKAHAKASIGQATLSGEVSTGVVLLTMLAVAGLSVTVITGIKRAISGIAHATETLASGDNRLDLDAIARGDELGAIVRSLRVFRENQLQLTVMNDEQETLRSRELATRTEAERARADVQAAQNEVVARLAEGLSRLSRGDMSSGIVQPFPAEYEALRADFNEAVQKLSEAMQLIAAATSQIRAGSDSIASASDDLSRRTEQQAASLEETAAALDEITATVKRSAEGAKHANTVAAGARDEAARSGEVMSEAVSAMGEIEQSSVQITQIIGVMDEIAFQTNLLALNAGVEAARAGESGRGFAVVAQEVRVLAQRSAAAAKEIKTLIDSSAGQVKRGVKLVSETGQALDGILSKVSEIGVLIAEIAASSEEQARGVGEINSAVNQMDRVTQQNAAMVEEASAASSELRVKAGELGELVGRFRTSEGGPTPAPRIANPGVDAPRRNPVGKVQARLAAALAPARGSAAPAADTWEEF
jgi:methyl-accepting chemotaxis protein